MDDVKISGKRTDIGADFLFVDNGKREELKLTAKDKILRAAVISGIVFIIAVMVFIVFISINNIAKDDFDYTNIIRKNIEVTVSSTGTIEASKQVEVSTQVSGKIVSVYADTNKVVAKGDILAKIDSTLLEISVKTAEAELLKAKSQYELALHEYNSNISLNKEKLVSNLQLEKLRVSKEGAYADLLSAEARLLTAKANLDYSIITAPINGIVLDKNVEEGQTVAASLSAPTLFTIAESLKQIKIKALVSESDIASIKEGQKIRFSVEAFPEKQFEGKVDSIFLNGTVVSNVVNYTVIIEADNNNKELFPGMTATIDFIIAEAINTLAVPNSSLSFRPSFEQLKKIGVVPHNPGDSAPPGNGLWIKNENGNISLAKVEIGISDGQFTAVTGDLIKEGSLIISGNNGKSANSNMPKNNQERRDANPSGRPGGGMPPPMMF